VPLTTHCPWNPKDGADSNPEPASEIGRKISQSVRGLDNKGHEILQPKSAMAAIAISTSSTLVNPKESGGVTSDGNS
jgi:hypothetical protein